MSRLSSLLFLLFLASVSFSQVSIDGQTFEISGLDQELFKVGSQIHICVINLPTTDKDKIEIVYTPHDFDRSNLATKFGQIAGISDVITTKEGKTMCFLPIQIQDMDISEITINRNDTKEKTTIESRSYKFYNSGGIKLDFSAGFFVTGLTDETYIFKDRILPDTTFYQENLVDTDSIVAINTIAKKEIIKEDNDDFRMGIGILAHLYRRSSSGNTLGLTMGFEVDQDSRVGYLAGLSLLLGHQNRFVLTAGTAIGKTRIKSNLYEVGELVSPETAIDAVTRERWSKSWFIAATYNF